MFASKTLKTGVKKANEATPDAEYFLTNQNHNKNPNAATQIPWYDKLMKWLKSGSLMKVGLIPEMAVEFEGRIPNISIAKFGKMPPQRKIGMVWRRNSPLKDKYYEIAQIVKSTKS